MALGGIAVGAPGQGGTIKGCYNDRGNLRVVDAGEACEGAETALTWSQTGPPGPRGPAGEPLPDTVAAGKVPHKLGTPKAPKRRELPKVRVQGKKRAKLKLKIGGEPTRIFSVRNRFEQSLPTSTGAYKTVARLVVLPGKYAVTAKTNVRGIIDVVVCALSYGTGAARREQSLTETRETLTFMLNVVATKSTAIELACGTSKSGLPRVENTWIRAMNVASISSKGDAPKP